MRFTLWKNKLWLGAVLLLFAASSTYLRVMSRMLFEGDIFRWSYETGLNAAGDPVGVSGTGLFGHASYVAALAFIIAALLFSALRRPDRVSAFLLFAWSAISFLSSAQMILGVAEPVLISMDTIGIHNEPMDWRFLVFPGAVAVIGLLLFLSTLPSSYEPPVRPWTSRNSLLCMLAAAFYAASGVLLNLGEQHGNGDLAGIIAMYTAFMLAIAGLAPWEKRTA